MASKNKKKDFNTGKSIAILFLYLFIWWILLTLIDLSLTISEDQILYYVLDFLRISVPIIVVLFGVPIILIIGSNKQVSKKKK